MASVASGVLGAVVGNKGPKVAGFVAAVSDKFAHGRSPWMRSIVPDSGADGKHVLIWGDVAVYLECRDFGHNDSGYSPPHNFSRNSLPHGAGISPSAVSTQRTGYGGGRSGAGPQPSVM